MNIWTAIVRIVEIFVAGGKPGYALTAFFSLMLLIAIIAVGVESKGRALLEGMTVPFVISQASNRQ